MYVAEAYDVSLAPHCPLGPIALASYLHVDFASYNTVLQEQSMGIHYNQGAELLDYVINKADFAMNDDYFYPLNKPGLGVDINEELVIERSKIPQTGVTRYGAILMDRWLNGNEILIKP